MKTYATSARRNLYQSLAEALSEPQSWFVHAGNNWQVYHAALQIAEEEKNTGLRRATLELALIPSATLSQRRKHYQRLISSAVYPNLSFHESLARGERLGGMLTIAVWTVYRSVCLQVDARLSPDHVAVELAFLAFLLEQEQTDQDNTIHWRRARKLFVRRHAGQWLPALGDLLYATHDPIYAPLGRILAIAIRTESTKNKAHRSRHKFQFPEIKQPETCNLCNFCVQVCPTNALTIQEDTDWTRLVIEDKNCVSCTKCVAVCPALALEMQTAVPIDTARSLKNSQRCHCPHCGTPTVSQAEINAMVEQIGHPAWLDYCSDCRSML